MADIKSLKEALVSINKKYEIGATVGLPDENEKAKFSLGTPSLDFITYNSIPEGIFIELSGQEGSGKTLLSYLIATDFIKKELKKPKSERRHILFVDAEGTLRKDWAEKSAGYIISGLDDDRCDIKTVVIPSQGQTAEEYFDAVREWALKGVIGLIIFDSLTVLAPQQVYDASFEQKDRGGVAKPLADFVKRCTGIFNKNNITFIGINGSIMNITGYGNPETTPGGTHWRRACSLRLKVKKGPLIDDENNELRINAENPAGNIVEVALLKSKFSRSDRRLGRTYLNYRRGLDLLQDTIDMAIHVGLIDNSSQGIYKIIDTDTGAVMLDEDGKEIKIRGKNNLKPYFIEHPEEWKKLNTKVYEVISEQDDPNIKSFEQLLNMNVEQEFGEDFSKQD